MISFLPSDFSPGRSMAWLPALVLSCLAGLSTHSAIAQESAPAAEDLSQIEQESFRSAAAFVSPSVVQVQPLGGLEKVGDRLVTPGPTSGLIVGEDGWIVTAEYGLAGNPTSILVTLPDGSRVAARKVAVDESRELVLLKVDAPSPLPVPVVSPAEETRVGQWAIAVGKTFSAEQPNISVGVVSALRRGWGRALQTDAKISPNNYGGPLIDLQGRVLGVLVPLGKAVGEGMEGPDWYDSGIGFAIPLSDILQRLSQWQSGENLRQGRIGISLKGGDLYGSPPVVGTIFPTSPAQKAGLKVGDRIVAINGREVNRQSEFKQQLEPLYAGDKVSLSIDRPSSNESANGSESAGGNESASGGESEKLTIEVELIAELPKYRRPWLGLLPVRGATRVVPPVSADSPTESASSTESATPTGVEVRWVFPEGPAARAGVQPGDRILRVQQTVCHKVEELRSALLSLEPDSEVEVELVRGTAEPMSVTIQLGLTDAPVPTELPPASLPAAADGTELPPRGEQSLKLPEEAGECLVYVPNNLVGQQRFGLLILFTQPGEYDTAAIVRDWSAVCEQRHLVLLAPKPTDSSRWAATDLAFTQKLIPEAIKRYELDSTRVACWGDEAGGAIAFAAAMNLRKEIRGVVAVSAALPERIRLVPHLPEYPLSILFAYRPGQAERVDIERSWQQFDEAKYPTTTLPLSSTEQVTESERDAIGRWLDTLDRI